MTGALADAPVDPTTTAGWARLTGIASRFEPDLRGWFAADPGRADRFTFDAADLHVDLSKGLVDDDVLAALVSLADEVGLEARRDAMFRGDRINVTEGRPVLHTALRLPEDAVLEVDGHDVVPDVHDVLRRVYAFADDVRFVEEGRFVDGRRGARLHGGIREPHEALHGVVHLDLDADLHGSLHGTAPRPQKGMGLGLGCGATTPARRAIAARIRAAASTWLRRLLPRSPPPPVPFPPRRASASR